MVSFAWQFTIQAFHGIKEYLWSCPPSLFYVLITFGVNATVCVWAIRALIQFSGCPHRMWLLVESLFAVLHMVAAVYLSYKIHIDYGPIAKNALVQDGESHVELSATKNASDPVMAANASSTPLAHDDYVHLEHDDKAFSEMESHSASYCVESTLRRQREVHSSALVRPPSAKTPPPHVSTTAPDSVPRLAYVMAHDLGGQCYQWALLAWFIWTVDASLFTGGNKNYVADCEQVTNLTEMASSLEIAYLFLLELIWIVAWCRYGCFKK